MSQAMVVGVFVASGLGALFAECICGGGFRFRRHLACGSVSPAIRKLCLSGVARAIMA